MGALRPSGIGFAPGERSGCLDPGRRNVRKTFMEQAIAQQKKAANMAHESNPGSSNEMGSIPPRRDSVVVERVAELTWALLDEQITADEMRLLDNLLLSGDDARRTYLDCVQLHTDLTFELREPMPAGGTRTGKSLVLGFLSETVPGTSVAVPSSEDTPA